MTLRDRMVQQFKRPHGLLGRLAGWIMATRASNRQRNAWTVGLLGVGSGDRVLEVGFGPGLSLGLCAERAVGGHVVGLDHSMTMLTQARARNAAAMEDGRITLHKGDLDALAGLPGPFHKVLSVNVVQFFPDAAAAYRTLFGVLAPEGLIATTYQPRHRNPTREDALRMAEDVARHMAAAEFIEIRTEELPLEPVPAVCVLGRRPRPNDQR